MANIFWEENFSCPIIFEKIGVHKTVVEVRKADFDVVVVTSPTNWKIYPKPSVDPIMSACLRNFLSFAFFGANKTRMPLLESSEMTKNIPSERKNLIEAKRRGDISEKAFCTMENVVPQTAVRIVRIIMARVLLLCFGMGEDNSTLSLEVPHLVMGKECPFQRLLIACHCEGGFCPTWQSKILKYFTKSKFLDCHVVFFSFVEESSSQ